jgi:predicted transcriptional regulator
LLPQENIIKAPKQHIEDILKKLSITRQIVCENLQENQDKRKKNMTRQPVNLII